MHLTPWIFVHCCPTRIFWDEWSAGGIVNSSSWKTKERELGLRCFLMDRPSHPQPGLSMLSTKKLRFVCCSSHDALQFNGWICDAFGFVYMLHLCFWICQIQCIKFCTMQSAVSKHPIYQSIKIVTCSVAHVSVAEHVHRCWDVTLLLSHVLTWEMSHWTCYSFHVCSNPARLECLWATAPSPWETTGS